MRARYYNPYICRFINADPSGFSGGLNFYAYADGNPVSKLDPFGLGALEQATTPSWIQQVATGLGWDTSRQAEEQREQAIIGTLSFGTLGLAEDLSVSGFGRTLSGSEVHGDVERRIEELIREFVRGQRG